MKSKTVKNILIVAIIVSLNIIHAQSNTDIMKIVKLSKNDLPTGFVFGKVPPFAKKVLKNNPWMLDRGAIKKLAGRIYPGGDFNKISGIHMTIMAKKRNPYGDDIVCYIIKYRSESAARDEIKKINSYAGYNRDRVILITKSNIAVYLHVDDTEDFHHIRNLAENMNTKLLNM